MSKRKTKAEKFSPVLPAGVQPASAFTVAGKKALLDMLAARPLRAALYDESGTELADGLGYAQGGVALSDAITGSDTGTAFLSFRDPQWPSAGFMGAAAMRIFDPETGILYAQLNFAQPLNGQGATFRVELPPQLITL
jgi:hypothetical protein